MKDKELTEFGTRLLEAFAKSAEGSTMGAARGKSRGFALGAGGVVEFTDDIISAHSHFVNRAAKLLKSKAAHEKAIASIALDHAHAFVANRKIVEDAVLDLIKEVFEKGNASFEYLAPNYVFRFSQPARDVRIGRVRAMLTDDFSAGWRSRFPDHRVSILRGDGFSLQLGQETIITVRPICWIVDVDAVAENVEEEAKWLIDVAISFLRLRHANWLGHFPMGGAVEPHPLQPTRVHHEGVKLQGSRVLAGGSSVPSWYEIDAAVVATTLEDKFVAQAGVIFDPPRKSLAERVHQGLGWLTRGRQAEDRAERLLYFFTAIEALLSTDDKTAPVVQTIARHAAALLSNDNSERAQLAKGLKTLYGQRSALVHSGNRSILWSGANDAQLFAENLFYLVLEKADLTIKHETFCNDLAAASYGTPWPPEACGA